MQEPVGRKPNVLMRVLATLAVGTAVAGTAYLCAFYELRWSYWHTTYGGFAWSKARYVRTEVEEFRKAKGHLPANLEEVREGGYRDVWERPYRYEVEGESFKLFSYGRDGEPGGEGLDADIDIHTRPKPPTLSQFTFEFPTEGIQVTCLLAGACAGIIILLQKRKQRWRGFLFKLGATAVGAVIAAIVIGVLHIPNGH